MVWNRVELGSQESRRNFAAKVRYASEDECWEWRGSRSRGGYGRIGIGGRLWGAHQIAWLLAFGYLSDRKTRGEVIAHHCDNRACVNPAHLFFTTQSGNMKDAARKGRLGIQNGAAKKLRGPALINSLKTHCIRGHLFAGDNLRKTGKKKQRGCRECFRKHDRELKQRLRNEAKRAKSLSDNT